MEGKESGREGKSTKWCELQMERWKEKEETYGHSEERDRGRDRRREKGGKKVGKTN